MSCEVVAIGIKGGIDIKGSAIGAAAAGSAAGTGAGAAGLAFLLFFFLGFLPPHMELIAPAWQQQHNAKMMTHCQICNCEPHEPDAVEPELPDPEESLALDPVLKESPELEEPAGPEPNDFNDPER